MNIEIIEAPLRFHLHGISGEVANEKYGEVGFGLMNALWPAIKAAGTKSTGINHWVYLPDNKMFVGVQLLDAQTPPNSLAPLEFELPRYLKHIHIGPYQTLPQKWKDLKAELDALGEVIGSPSLEIYGHHSDDPAKIETTIVIGLKAKTSTATH